MEFVKESTFAVRFSVHLSHSLAAAASKHQYITSQISSNLD